MAVLRMVSKIPSIRLFKDQIVGSTKSFEASRILPSTDEDGTSSSEGAREARGGL